MSLDGKLEPCDVVVLKTILIAHFSALDTAEQTGVILKTFLKNVYICLFVVEVKDVCMFPPSCCCTHTHTHTGFIKACVLTKSERLYQKAHRASTCHQFFITSDDVFTNKQACVFCYPHLCFIKQLKQSQNGEFGCFT